MSTKDESGFLGGMIREILNFAKRQNGKPAASEAEKYFHSAARVDYRAALRKHLNRPQLEEILRELRAARPTLNREVFRIKDTRRMAKIAAEMGVILQARTFEGSSGRELRGFYVNDGELLKRPLIGVNTANHPVAVAAAFWHEIGHHLTNAMFGLPHHQLNLFAGADYHKHLEDPREIAADILMVLACYPHDAAKQLFRSEKNSLMIDANLLLSTVFPHVRAVTGFDFETHFSITENLHYLAGLIHVAKLRGALLAEYEI
jgi:hypothetical protein